MSETREKMLDVILDHDGHLARVGGPLSAVAALVSADGSNEDIARRYLGFTVDCVTCNVSLSDQWNGA